jgi:transposase
VDIKEREKTIGMTGRQYRLNVIGGICLSNHKVVYKQANKVNEHSIQDFLYHLRKQHPGRYKVHIIWDNAGYHCSKAVTAFAKELGIEIHFLPPYSPNLNPVERLWKLLHQQVTRNRYYQTFADFTNAVLLFFRHIGKKKKLLQERINDNFQKLDVPNFAS